MTKFKDFYTEKEEAKKKKDDLEDLPIDADTPDDAHAHFEPLDDEEDEKKKNKSEKKESDEFAHYEPLAEGEDWDEAEKHNPQIDLSEKITKKKVIRFGKKVIKRISDRAGFRVVKTPEGMFKEIRIKAAEKRKRILGQLKGKIKRKAKAAISQIRRKLSLRKRASIFGKNR